MLLDLNQQGSMTVCKNNVRLGLMQGEGLRFGVAVRLTGPLCWVFSTFKGSTRIESVPLPEQ